jgi:very-short-patch-repair endonuclease
VSNIVAKHASEPEFIFAHQALADKLPPFVCEYRFDDVRKFRFDFAWPDRKFAVELEGGIFSKGAHSRPLGILRDIDKGNLAVMKGWSVLRFSPAQVKNGEALAMVKKWLEQSNGQI